MKVKIYGPGIDTAQVNTPTHFCIDTSGYKNLFIVWAIINYSNLETHPKNNIKSQLNPNPYWGSTLEHYSYRTTSFDSNKNLPFLYGS